MWNLTCIEHQWSGLLTYKCYIEVTVTEVVVPLPGRPGPTDHFGRAHMITYDRLFIAGSWTDPSSPDLLDIRSPHDRTVIGRAAQARPADVDRSVAAARAAFAS